MITEMAFGLRGFDAAVDRARTARDEDHLLAVGEALWWLGAVSDLDEKRDGKDYYSERDSSPEGETVGGLVYARNLVAHGLATVLGLVSLQVMWGDEPIMATDGPVLAQANGWQPFYRLPSPQKPEQHGRDRMYEQRVAGREVLSPLDAAALFLHRPRRDASTR